MKIQDEQPVILIFVAGFFLIGRQFHQKCGFGFTMWMDLSNLFSWVEVKLKALR